MSHPPCNFPTMANSSRDQSRRDREAIRAAEQALIEAGFGFAVMLEEPAPVEATATPVTRPPLAA